MSATLTVEVSQKRIRGIWLINSIPEREYEVRKDVREECIFTIDPPTAKDLDDAVSIKENDDGTFRVGVHIADVSYFGKLSTTPRDVC